VTARGLRRAVAAVLVTVAGLGSAGVLSPVVAVATAAPTAAHVPVYAYFYQWFDRGSWTRAKQDYPLAGKYSSDDPHVVRNQVTAARSTGIDGFLTSWKSTPSLNRRLTLLLQVAHDENFDVGVVYEALNFQRTPLPITTVRRDMLKLVRDWGPDLTSRFYHRPVIVWTGIDQYPVADVAAVRAALGSSAYLLAASKSVDEYRRVAGTVDGEAYYWSSANPRSPFTRQKLVEMSAAVHRRHGIWIAPAASGFDGTTLGHSRVIDRDKGQTLRRSLDNAYASTPDAVGVISWNEWSENTYIEPGRRYGTEELGVLRRYLATREGRPSTSPQATVPRSAPRGTWSGLQAVLLLTIVMAVGVVGLTVRVSGRERRSDLHEAGLHRPDRFDQLDRIH
jgi:glycosyl hydrolase family 99